MHLLAEAVGRGGRGAEDEIGREGRAARALAHRMQALMDA